MVKVKLRVPLSSAPRETSSPLANPLRSAPDYSDDEDNDTSPRPGNNGHDDEGGDDREDGDDGDAADEESHCEPPTPAPRCGLAGCGGRRCIGRRR